MVFQYIWRCDPREHIEGSTFLQLTRLLQGTIVTDRHLFSREDKNCLDGHDVSVINNRCTHIFAGPRAPPRKVCSNSECNGKVYDCKNIDSVTIHLKL